MKSLTFGVIPKDLEINEPYMLGNLNQKDLEMVAEVVNQGIDSHLEAVFTSQHGPVNDVEIEDSASMRCFLRRLMERGDERAEDMASAIMFTLGYEWV